MSDDPRPITVKELRELLAKFPDGMPCVFRQYSEYAALTAKDIETQRMFDAGGYWSRVYRDEDEARATTMLVFPGN